MLKALAQKSYVFFWGAIPFILIPAILISKDSIMEIGARKAYFVASPPTLGLFFSLFLAVTGFFYWLLRKKQLIRWLTLSHTIITLSGLLIVIFSMVNFDRPHYKSMQSDSLFIQIISVISVIWIASQSFFVANLTIGILKKSKRGMNISRNE